jgi:hypothetical protein
MGCDSSDVNVGRWEGRIPRDVDEDLTPMLRESIKMVEDKKLEGRKDDKGKLRYDLIPVYPLTLLAEVYTIGSIKYDDENWRQGISWKRIFAAMMRHAWNWMAGEEYDNETGQHHLASVAWCAFALIEYEKTHPEFDDRVPSPGTAIRTKGLPELLRKVVAAKKP